MRRLCVRRLCLIVLFAGFAFAQATISTFAGKDWNFPFGVPALEAPFGSIENVAIGPSGTIYLADRQNRRIFRIADDGTVELVAGTGGSGSAGDGGPATQATFTSFAGLAAGPDGSLYVSDDGAHRIRRIDSEGTITTIAGTGAAGFSGDGGPATEARLSIPAGLSLDPSGRIIFVDFGNSRIRAIGLDGVIQTIAGTGEAASNGDGGPALSAAVFPEQLVVSPDGTIFFTEYAFDKLRAIAADGTITTIAGNGRNGPGRPGVQAIQSPLSAPRGLTYDNGRILFGEHFSGRVLTIDPEGALQLVATLSKPQTAVDPDANPVTPVDIALATGLAIRDAGRLVVATLLGDLYQIDLESGGIERIAGNRLYRRVLDGASALEVSFDNPQGLAFDSQGNLYVGDRGSGRVSRITPDGQFAHAAGTVPGFCCRNGLDARIAYLSDPAAVATDADGNLYIADVTVHRVHKVTPDGIIRVIAGTGAARYSGDGGPANRADLLNPAGLAFDAQGRLLIADFGNRRVRRINSDGTIETIAGDGRNAYAGDGGPATQAAIRRPIAFLLLPSGDILVSDILDHRIRRISTDGTISTYAGTGTAGFSGDGGLATEARFNGPGSLALDRQGNVFVIDQGNRRIRKITPDGVVSTVAGNGRIGFAGDGGPALDASFTSLQLGLAFDATGRLYVSDGGAGRIRVIDWNEQPQ